MYSIAPYIALIVTAVIAVITIISKTDTSPEEKTEGHVSKQKTSLLKRPTLYGYAVILLTVIAGIAGWLIENDKAKKDQIELLTHFRDSTNQSNSFKQVTTAQSIQLRKQDKQLIADSIQHRLDSINADLAKIRYDTTLQRFDKDFENQQRTLASQRTSLENQKTALENETVTLDHIQEGLHPLYPLTASLRFQITIPNKFLDTSQAFQRWWKPLHHMDDHPGNAAFYDQSEPGNFNFYYRGHLPSEPGDTSKNLVGLNRLIYFFMLPKFKLFFYTKPVSNATNVGGNTELDTQQHLITIDECEVNYHVYKINDAQIMECTLTYDQFHTYRYDGTVTSMYSIKGGDLIIEPYYIDAIDVKLQMFDAVFTTGPDHKKYVVYVDSSDQLPYRGSTNDFVKSGHEILTSAMTDRPFFPDNLLGPIEHER